MPPLAVLFIKTRLLFLSAVLIAVATVTPAPAQSFRDLPAAVSPQIQLSSARSPRLRVSCAHPNAGSYRKRRGIMAFTLTHGDIGGCYTDKTADHSGPHVPYMERVEMYSDFRDVGPRYRFSALVHMDPGFASAPETTVFQVHQWVQESCQCGPPVMLTFDAAGQVQAWILTAPHRHVKRPLKGWTRERFAKGWVEVAVDITSAYGRQNVTVWLGGEQVLSHEALVQPGGALFLKVGLYRPGTARSRLPTDRAYVREVKIGRLN